MNFVIHDNPENITAARLDDTCIIIKASSSADKGYISLDVDADIVTLGVVAKLLLHKYTKNLMEFEKSNKVPADTDARIQAVVNEYLCSSRNNIKIVGGNNG